MCRSLWTSLLRLQERCASVISTRSILEAMAKYAEEIEDMFNINFHGSGDNAPEEIRHTILLYHQASLYIVRDGSITDKFFQYVQCIIIATRPLLLSVLKERLEKLGREEEDWQKFLTLPKSLISIGIKSAEKILQMLSDENALVGKKPLHTPGYTVYR